MRLIYLSGPICGLTHDDAVHWRDVAVSLFKDGITGVCPLRGKMNMLGKEPIGNHTSAGATHPMLTSRGITARDRMDVQNCDAMLVWASGMNRDSISCGTMIEMGWADLLRKPIIWADYDTDGYAARHPMVRDLISYKVRTLEEAAEIINHMFIL